MNVGSLAVMNNLLIPAGIIVNVVIWNRDADILRLSIGAGICIVLLKHNIRCSLVGSTLSINRPGP